MLMMPYMHGKCCLWTWLTCMSLWVNAESNGLDGYWRHHCSNGHNGFIVHIIKEAKTVYYRNVMKENRHYTRALREISPRNDSTSMMPKSVKSGNIDVTYPFDIAQTFNRLFSTIAYTYLYCDNHDQQHHFQTLDEHVMSKLARNIPDSTHEYVLHKQSTQPNRATGADCISAELINKSTSQIAVRSHGSYI